MSLPFLTKLIASLSIIACSPAFADVQYLPTDNIYSFGHFGDPDNTVIFGSLPANAIITDISYSVALTAFPGSTLNDISVALTNSALDGISFTPASGAYVDGTYNGRIDLTQPNNSVIALGIDGLLRFEFFQGDEDVTGAGGLWNSGRISFAFTLPGDPVDPVDPGVPAGVPEPATGALMAAGLGIMVYAGRRRPVSRASRATPTLH
jgi:hypothetical protein